MLGLSEPEKKTKFLNIFILMSIKKNKKTVIIFRYNPKGTSVRNQGCRLQTRRQGCEKKSMISSRL